MSAKAAVNPYKMTARIVGGVYLAGFVVGIGGEALIQSVITAPNHLAVVSVNSLRLSTGVLLWLITVAGDAAHGVLMFPILKQHSERIALGYFGARIIDAVLIAVMAILHLFHIPLGREFLKAAAPDALYLQALSAASVQAGQYAYQMGMMTLGIAGVMLCYSLIKTKLVPRWLAVWGLVGYTIIFGGMVSEMLGSGLGLASSIPGGLWEMFIGVWLIVKGFSASAFGSQPTTTSTPTESFVPLPDPANP